ncbi:hypothetical protein VFPFJ_10164 [Purpureocillium lilacinum]|uniref:WAP domain-containing protein n=1 Tax=Purpureocillium lilacinum TaxID=33203 RepID=A0A179GJZ7_PURLI|nr:hypothetical protein VFPFJ_10164 [Purpureocillium lilacinum]OAQ78132.1 hypothetical protein VFPFJ_10164 [Purpureocillium lilacinum]
MKSSLALLACFFGLALASSDAAVPPNASCVIACPQNKCPPGTACCTTECGGPKDLTPANSWTCFRHLLTLAPTLSRRRHKLMPPPDRVIVRVCWMGLANQGFIVWQRSTSFQLPSPCEHRTSSNEQDESASSTRHSCCEAANCVIAVSCLENNLSS